MTKTASLTDLVATCSTKYDHVEAYGTTVRIGSLSSAEMIDWIEAQTDVKKRRFAGILLLVMSLVGPDGDRFPVEERDAMVEVFKDKDATQNRIVIKRARLLNGLEEIPKNVQGEAVSSGSPTASPSPSDD